MKTSAEELQGLSSRAGRQAAPTQPLEAAVIGGTPSQAKMAGSSANLGLAQKVSVGGEQELPTYLRRLQAARPLLEEEQARIDRAKSMGQLNSLEERVQSAALSTLGATSGAATIKVNEDKLPSTLVGTARTTAINLLKKAAAPADPNNPVTDADWQNLASLLGFGPDKTLDQIKADITGTYFQTQQDALAASAAAGTPDKVTLDRISPQDLGFNDWAEVAALLKLPEGTDMSTMTVGDLTSQIEKVQTEEYSRTSALLRIIRDPNVGPAEKEAARRQLEQLGATGILAAEADVSNLAAQIEDINTVTIAGQDYTVSELLSDKTITLLIDDYLKNPDKAAAIRASSPEFADWIDSNKEALSKTIAAVGTGLAGVATVVEENNKKKAPVPSAPNLSDSVMTTLYGSNWKNSTTPLQSPAIYTALSDSNIDETVRADLVGLMNELGDRPDDLQFLAGLSAAELNSRGLLTSEGIRQYKDYINSSEFFAATDTSILNNNAIIKQMFGDSMTEASMNKLLTQVKALNDTNLVDDLDPEEYAILQIFDANNDGKIDKPAEIAERAKSFFTGKSLRDLVNGVDDLPTGSSLLQTLRDKVTSETDSSTVGGRLLATYGKILEDGKIGADEVAKLQQLNTPIQDLQLLVDKKVPGASKLTGLISTMSQQAANMLIGNDTNMLLNSKVGSMTGPDGFTVIIPWGPQNVANWTKGLDNMIAGISLGTFSNQPASVKARLKTTYDTTISKMQESLDRKIWTEYSRRTGSSPYFNPTFQVNQSVLNEVKRTFASDQSVIDRYKGKFKL